MKKWISIILNLVSSVGVKLAADLHRWTQIKASSIFRHKLLFDKIAFHFCFGLFILIIVSSCSNPMNSKKNPDVHNIGTVKNTKQISFVDKNIGFAYSESNLYRTTNGGENWTELSDVPQDIQKVKFATEKIGWLLTKTTLYKTENGGGNWIIKKSGINANFFNDIVAPSKKRCIYTTNESSGFYMTNNGGDNWQFVELDGIGAVRDFEYVSDNNWYVLFAGGQIFKTFDSGVSFEKFEHELKFATCIEITNEGKIYLGNTSLPSSMANFPTSISCSKNGGKDWDDIVIDSVDWIENIAFVNEYVGYALCRTMDAHFDKSSTIQVTNNKGKHWRKMDLNNKYPVDIDLVDNQLFVLTTDGDILVIK